MADEVKGTGAPTAPAGDAAPAKEQQPTEYAGTFKGEEALYKGLSEIRKAHGMPEKAPDVLAKMYADPKEAEAEYSALRSALSKRAKDVGKTGTVLDQTLKPEAPATQDDGVDVPIHQVLSKAGVTEQAIFQEATASGTVSDDTVEKIRAAHPTLSQVSKAQAHRIIRTEIQQQVRETQRVVSEGAAIAGSQEALQLLVAERDKYVPPERLAAVNRMLNDNDLFAEGVRLIKQYQEAKAPAPQKGTVTGDRGAARPSASRRTEVVMALAKDPNNPALLAELRKLSQR